MKLFNSCQFLSTVAITLISITSFTGCKQVQVGPEEKPLNADTLGAYIEKRVKDNVTGYQIVIYSKGTIAFLTAGGQQERHLMQTREIC